MINIKGDLFHEPCDVICITTNGFVKTNGSNVMGMGCAKKASEIDKSIPILLGKALRKYGNVVNYITTANNIHMYSFPVKPTRSVVLPSKVNVVKHMQAKVSCGHRIGGWACVAETQIIKESAMQLKKLADKNGWTKVVIPRPGCGAGELSWDVVEPLLQDILDDRFYSITF